jgi:hypothetical protein
MKFAGIAAASAALICSSCGSSGSSSTATTPTSVATSSTAASSLEPTSSTATEPPTTSTAAPTTSVEPTVSAAPTDTSTTATAVTATVPQTTTVLATTAPQTDGCTAGELTATAEPLSDSVMQNIKLAIDVTNTGARSCILPATPPTLSSIGDGGSQVPFDAEGDGTYFGSPAPLTGPLEPGSSAVVWVGGISPEACEPSNTTQTWPSMVLGLPDGTTLSFATPFDTKCGIHGITPFGTG